MTPLGQSLVFYLKYWPEMNHLLRGGGRGSAGLADLPDRNRVLSMVRAVDKAARGKAVELLRACRTEMMEKLSDFEFVWPVRRRAAPIWETKVSLFTRKGQIEVGVSVLPEQQLLVPWVKSRVRRSARDQIVHILGWHGPVVTRELVPSPRIALAAYRLLPPALEGFDVDREPLVRSVGRVFAGFTREKIDAVLALTSTAEPA